jgi:hypothetical protein
MERDAAPALPEDPMTLRSAIVALTVIAPTLAGAGEVTGRIRFQGVPPAAASVPTTKDRDTCGASQPDESLLVSGGGLANAVVRIDASGGGPAPVRAVLDQLGCRFVPHVQVVPAGSTLEIRNGDPILHGVHGWTGLATAFDVPMPSRDARGVARTLSRPGLVRVGCDVHAWMSAYVIVTATPFATVTDAQGAFAIAGVPPGTWPATVWHERLGERKAQVTVPASGAARLDLAWP